MTQYELWDTNSHRMIVEFTEIKQMTSLIMIRLDTLDSTLLFAGSVIKQGYIEITEWLLKYGTLTEEQRMMLLL